MVSIRRDGAGFEALLDPEALGDDGGTAVAKEMEVRETGESETSDSGGDLLVRGGGNEVAGG